VGPLQRADGRGSLTLDESASGQDARHGGGDLRQHFRPRSGGRELNGVELGLPRSALPEPDEDDDFYHADLIGLEARLADGTRFGAVLQVANYGADDLLDMKPDRGGPSVLVPFTKAVVPVIKPCRRLSW
jgi:16S rRNA processing protein RimM